MPRSASLPSSRPFYGDLVGKVPQFDPEAGAPSYLYARMADHLEARIRAGELAKGARLPGERDLASEYGVAIGTARRAVEELRQRGMVVTLPAKGTFISWPAGG
jgi:DNA-binding GntR family transcriptional regulator